MVFRRVAHLVAWFSGAAVLAASGCLAPTLPLPPPELPESVHEVSANQWLVTGSCTPGALVTVFNMATGQGVVEEDRTGSGEYAITIAGERCDTAWVTEQFEAELSAQTTFWLDERSGGDNSGGSCQ